jgi:hypothetical protein
MKIKVTSGLAALTLTRSLQVGAQAAQTSNRESEPANSAFVDWWNGKCATGNGLGLLLEWKANVRSNIDGVLQQRFGYDDPEPFSVRDFLTLSGGWQNPSDFFIVRSGKFFINNTFNSGRALAGSEIPRGGSYSAWDTLRSSPSIGITGGLYLAIPKRAATAARGGILMVVSLVMPCLNQRGEKTPTQAGCLVAPSARRLGLSLRMRGLPKS